MTLLERVHENYVVGRRARVLAGHLAELIPERAQILDVGCGDGKIASLIQRRRADITVRGIDCLVRPGTHIAVSEFDGQRIPAEDDSVDVVTLVDVLHHAELPQALLGEAARVARHAVVIKDVALRGWMAEPTLRFMDRVGNARHGVRVPDGYWTPAQWRQAFAATGLDVEVWKERLGLYPAPFSWILERSFHFVGRLAPRRDG
jgi:SAM-dependent methyltransferase